jgi:hypothetical protein
VDYADEFMWSVEERQATEHEQTTKHLDVVVELDAVFHAANAQSVLEVLEDSVATPKPKPAEPAEDPPKAYDFPILYYRALLLCPYKAL